MKRTLAALLAALLLSIPTQAHDWSKVAFRLSQATAMLTSGDGEGFCSGFSIDNKRDYLLTASHCVHLESTWGGFLVDNITPTLVADRPEQDVAVLHVEGMDRPELKPRTDLIRVGMEVGTFGFALEDNFFYHFRAGNISGITNGGEFGSYSNGEILIYFDQALVGGMSGGPTVDTDGKVVLVNQLSNRSSHSAGVNISSIYRATSQYWRQ